MINSVIIIQPPFVQLNGPYPSGAYLASFFSNRGLESIKNLDLSNAFFHYIFSSQGIRRLFSLTLELEAHAIEKARLSKDIHTAETVVRFRSTAASWIRWIDDIVLILCTGNREKCHAFVASPYAPRGPRMEAYLQQMVHELTADDARVLATLALEDLGDYISYVYDDEFALVRYGASLAASTHSFSVVKSGLQRPLMLDFLQPFIQEMLEGLFSESHTLVCISVPFPGALVCALAIGRFIKERYLSRATVLVGGGYVSTELRDCDVSLLEKYLDALVFDRGYGVLSQILEKGCDFDVPQKLFCPSDYASIENELTRTLVPDYSAYDFNRYPRLADTPNPMHRLWSDGAWLKAYLAHGCYWHRCSFCDVSLDYVCSYTPVAVKALYEGLLREAVSSKVSGIHFVDEAAPPRALRDFARYNLASIATDGPFLSFWGNIRFEKTFTRDLADFLSAGGLRAVSGGIEIASPSGFASVDKGIDLENLVAVCAAFKEAGVLVHAYLIYGYWDQDAQGIIDSFEVMRQLFAAGLVDSAFWHKFVLTRHSRVYTEWKDGKHSGLVPIEETGNFANNDLRFEGESSSNRFSAPLDAALHTWMVGEGFEKPVKSWFPFVMPSPKIEKNLIENYIARYEERTRFAQSSPCNASLEYWWLASMPVSQNDDEGGLLLWWHLGDEFSISVENDVATKVCSALLPCAQGKCADISLLQELPRKVFKELRKSGLVVL